LDVAQDVGLGVRAHSGSLRQSQRSASGRIVPP
jgi:hypothetical protein